MNKKEWQIFEKGLEAGNEDREYILAVKAEELPAFLEQYFDNMRAEKRLYADLFKDDLAEQILQFLLQPPAPTIINPDEIIEMNDNE